MRFFAGSLVSLFILACGAISMMFDTPRPYITRNVDKNELIGVWTVTPRSEASRDSLARRSPDTPAVAPWRSMRLNADGSCHVDLAPNWLGDTVIPKVSRLAGGAYLVSSCIWQLTEFVDIEGKHTPAVTIAVEGSDYSGGGYLFVSEENGGLTLWTFMGEPDASKTLDFRKANQ